MVIAWASEKQIMQELWRYYRPNTKIIRLSGQMRVIDPRATQSGISTFYFSRNEYDKFAHRSD